MRLFTTTSDFTVNGIPYPGIPFLVYESMELAIEVNDFLLWVALENARTSSPLTWKVYAESLYDFFSWLEANNFDWIPSKSQALGHQISILAMYRNWSLGLKKGESKLPLLEVSTIRKRLTHIMAFYKWAYQKKRISHLPWIGILRKPATNRFAYNTIRHADSIAQDNLRPKARKKSLKVLNLEQCKLLLDSCSSAALKLMTKLMLQTGLRNEECRTFHRKYVFDPVMLSTKNNIALNLEPTDMRLKGSKPRRVYISWQLMKALFDYINFGEGAERLKLYKTLNASLSPYIFLNKEGQPFSEKSLNNTYRKLWNKSNGKTPVLTFVVTPHMLRHTFATFELFGESKRSNLGNALAWVRDRLGHTSIVTTTMYVHCLEQLEQKELNWYHEELDKLGN